MHPVVHGNGVINDGHTDRVRLGIHELLLHPSSTLSNHPDLEGSAQEKVVENFKLSNLLGLGLGPYLFGYASLFAYVRRPWRVAGRTTLSAQGRKRTAK